MAKNKIMLVDDEEAVLESFKRGLKGEGYEIITAVNSKEAFNKLNAFPDICLLYTSPSPRDAHESRMPSSA